MVIIRLLWLAILMILIPAALGQSGNPSSQSPKNQESSFLAEFNLVDGGGVMRVIQESARGKIDKIESGGIESKVERDGRVFLTRRYEAEIGEIDTSIDYDLLSSIKGKIQERLRKSSLQFKVANDYHRVFAIDYESGCTVGSVDIRGTFGEDKHYHLFFIFHESYCKSKSKS